ASQYQQEKTWASKQEQKMEYLSGKKAHASGSLKEHASIEWGASSIAKVPQKQKHQLHTHSTRKMWQWQCNTLKSEYASEY
nr:hypothetical protein [Tanacetum cinerariifolium]